ncbi:PKD domain-containing protein [Janibacter anophelis]|uniref:PKD domain-containing protein n=1 Tax=Janibacter anophelis TaxID=319054 RepID=UPI003F7DFF1A
MLTLRSRVAGLVLAVLVVLPLAGFTLGDPPAGCKKWDEATSTCLIEIEVPADPQDPPQDGGDTDPVSGGEPDPCLDWAGKEVECSDGKGGWWSNDDNCYVTPSMYDYPKSHPIWEGNTTGALYDCYNAAIQGTRMGTVWLEFPPGPQALPDPETLARQAMAAMDLRAPRIGIAPEDTPGSVGLVGLPVWMWVDDPGQHTWGPITKKASAAGHTVTATGEVDKLVWDMGDGTKVTCTTQGTEFTVDKGLTESPDCGHKYTAMGDYTVTVTAYWTIDWAGLGQTGELSTDVQRSTTVRIGEAQAVKNKQP